LSADTDKIFAEATVPFAILDPTIVAVAICVVVIVPAAIFPATIVFAAISFVVTEPATISPPFQFAPPIPPKT
jgi:hypothetical protein